MLEGDFSKSTNVPRYKSIYCFLTELFARLNMLILKFTYNSEEQPQSTQTKLLFSPSFKFRTAFREMSSAFVVLIMMPTLKRNLFATQPNHVTRCGQ